MLSPGKARGFIDMLARALDGLRVVEFCDEIGSYCGKLLADLGAEVIKIEPPGGGTERHNPPFIKSVEESPDTSLAFWVHNTSKQSVVIDLESEHGSALARCLSLTADVLLEDYPVGHLEERGLGYDALRTERPSLVYSSATGFGQNGTHPSWSYSDLIGQAMGGVMTLAGFPEDPPHLIYGNQANVSASIHAAQGTLLAVLHAEVTGQGQCVDTSAQEAMSISQETAMQTWDMLKTNRVRSGGRGILPLQVPGSGIYEAADGYVFLMVHAPAGRGLTAFVEWMAEHGMSEGLDEEPLSGVVAQLNMRTLTAMLTSGKAEEIEGMTAQFAEIDEAICEFVKTLPARIVYEEGQNRQLLIGLVSTPADLVTNPQLRARGFYQDFDVEPGATIEFPGPPYRLSETPALVDRPPRLGEHTSDVLTGLLGLGPDEIAALEAEGAIGPA